MDFVPLRAHPDGRAAGDRAALGADPLVRPRTGSAAPRIHKPGAASMDFRAASLRSACGMTKVFSAPRAWLYRQAVREFDPDHFPTGHPTADSFDLFQTVEH